jgi:hypothetical protein
MRLTAINVAVCAAATTRRSIVPTINAGRLACLAMS